MTEMTADSANRSRLRVILAASVGSALEWYDFFLYGTAAALIFGPLFFPLNGDPAGPALYWELANATRGALVSPAKSWPDT